MKNLKKFLFVFVFTIFCSASTQSQIKTEEYKNRSTFFKEKLIIAGHGLSFLVEAASGAVLLNGFGRDGFIFFFGPLFLHSLTNDIFSIYTFFQLIKKREEGATLGLKFSLGYAILLNLLSVFLSARCLSSGNFNPLMLSGALLNALSIYTLVAKYRGIFFEKTLWPGAKKTEPVIKIPEIPKEDLEKLEWV